MSEVDFHWSEYIKTGSEAFVLLKSLYPLLPVTPSRDEVEAKILAAEEALKKADVALALAWGFKVHDCTYPPQIMLYDKNVKDRVCPGCGFTLNFNRPISGNDYEDDFITARR
jgi:hypothetical protein